LKILKYIFVISALLTITLTSSAKTAAGIWQLQGTNSLKGAYQGELELRPNQDGSTDAIRLVTYQNYSFQGYQVQEIWTGKARENSAGLNLQFSLKKADHITRLGSLYRDPSDFKTKLDVQIQYVKSNNVLQSQFNDLETSVYTESLLGAPRAIGAKPLWQDQRVKIDAKGPRIPLIVRGVIKAIKIKIEYDKDPFVKSFSERPEFKNENPYLIFDPTDYEFYQNNRNILRVNNKVVDDISLTESLVRRNAYAPTIEEKAQGYEKNASERHIDTSGMYVSLRVDDQDRILEEYAEGDSTLWTGMYVGSQAMRYKVTKDPEALANVRRSLKAMFLLLDIAGDPKEFARTVRTYDPKREMTGRWRRGVGRYAHLDWMSGGNNDMLKGITHSFIWATEVIPKSEVEIWDQLREKSRRLLQLKVLDEKPQNKPVALGLAALINEDAKLREQYIKAYKSIRVRMTGYNFNTDFYWHGTADWSGINLGIVGDITNITLADRLGATEIRDKLRTRMMDTWVVFKPARRHLQSLATYGWAYRFGARSKKFDENSSDQEFRQSVNLSIWGLREIPYPRPTHLDVSVDHSFNPEWSLSPIPRLFWKAVKKPEPPVDYFYQGLYDFPIFEQDIFDSTFLWKSAAFGYQVSHKNGDEYAGIDFLYAYWLCRYTGIPLTIF
jgi:hypothetical protein